MGLVTVEHDSGILNFGPKTVVAHVLGVTRESVTGKKVAKFSGSEFGAHCLHCSVLNSRCGGLTSRERASESVGGLVAAAETDMDYEEIQGNCVAVQAGQTFFETE